METSLQTLINLPNPIGFFLLFSDGRSITRRNLECLFQFKVGKKNGDGRKRVGIS